MIGLRPLTPNDAAAIHSAVDRSRPELRRWMSWYHDAYGPADAESWLEFASKQQAAGACQHFAICDEKGVVVGVLGFEDIGEHGRAMIGYWIATPSTGRGLGTQAIRDALDWARKEARIETVWAIVAEANAASRRVLERNGFQFARFSPQPSVAGDRQLIYELCLR
jgi:ribosomal-protein-serine acetyltransferase